MHPSRRHGQTKWHHPTLGFACLSYYNILKAHLVLLQSRFKNRHGLLAILSLWSPLVVGLVRELIQDLVDDTKSSSSWVVTVCKGYSNKAIPVVSMAEVLLILHSLPLSYLSPEDELTIIYWQQRNCITTSLRCIQTHISKNRVLNSGLARSMTTRDCSQILGRQQPLWV